MRSSYFVLAGLSLALACGNPSTDLEPADAGESSPDASGTGGVDAGNGEADAATPPPDAGVFDCFGKADGIDCAESSICLKGRCETSSCGDGFVYPPAGEQCEDGNEVDGDGCSRCRFDCAQDADCDDDNPCTVDRCDKTAGSQVCDSDPVAGAPACPLAGGGNGTCAAGACVKAGCGNGVVETGEECDDKNADDT
ncbi:MAG: DUF4215 domain-containing protein, partial [Myxococcales bacterium]